MEKNKHDHKFTKLLKLALFGGVMVLPFMAIMSSTIYSWLNKNAKDSFATGDEIQQATLITSQTQLIQGANMMFSYYEDSTASQTQIMYVNFTSLSFDPTDYGYTEHNYTKINISNKYLYLSDGTYTDVRQIWGTEIKQFTITFASAEEPTRFNNQYKTFKIYILTTRSATLSDAFYSSCNEIWNQDIFSWTKNSLFATPITSFTSVFGISSTNFFNYLIVYWASITAIYLVLDIIIEVCIYLTHLLSKEK